MRFAQMSSQSTTTVAPGHLGNLDSKQEAALKAVKTGIEGKNYKTDDHELLRFLRAQKWDAKKTTDLFHEYQAWRTKHNVDRILDKMPARAAELRKVVPSCFHGYDKKGQPCYIEKSGQIDVATITSLFTDDEIFWAHIWDQENQYERCRDQSTKHKRHIETVANILDLKGLNSGHRKILKFTKAITECDQKYYPERLGRLYVINAPWIFPVIYNICKPWLDPVTRAKITVLKSDFKTKLAEDFDLDQLPSEYGGTCKSCELAPDCVKVFDITEFKKEMSKDEDAMEFTTQEIAARGKFEKKLEGPVGSTFSWYFKTDAHDLSFQVDFEPEGKDSKRVTINNPARLDCANFAVQGEWTSREPGSVILVFDNGFSWVTGKTLRYCCAVMEPEKGTEDKKDEKKEEKKDEKKSESTTTTSS